MTQLETPVQTPHACRKRVRSVTPPGTPVEGADEITAVEDERIDDNEDEEDSEGESEEEAPPQPTWKKNARFLLAYLLRRDDTRSATHSSLIGGRYFIPQEMRQEFYRRYYTEVLSTTPSLFLTERYNDELFRFFADIDYDFTEGEVPSHVYIIRQIREALASLLRLLGGRGLPYQQAIEHFPARAARRTDWKLHVIFPKTAVDWKTVLLFGQAVQKKLDLAEDNRIHLDMKVYHRGSLRMIGSYKASETLAKHERETEFLYTPINTETGEALEWTENMPEEYSIFLTPQQRASVEQADEQGLVMTDDDILNVPGALQLGGVNVPDVQYTYTGTGSVLANSPLFNVIKEHFGDVFASAAGKIIHNSETNCSAIDCSRTTYCPLAKRFHSSNHAYIVLSEFGMRVKCYSTSDEACRKGGQLIRRNALPDEVLSEFPAVPVRSALEVQARLRYSHFIDDGFRIFEDDAFHYQFLLTLSGTDHYISEFVALFMGDRFACADADKQIWYHYKHPLWRFKEAKNDVYNAVGDVLVCYDQAVEWYLRAFTGEKEVRADRVKILLKTKDRISDYATKSKIMRTLAHKYFDARFEGRLDSNRSLIGFNDGVFDLTKREFRGGAPSDLISMTVGYNYPRASNPTYRARLDTLLSNMQPEDENLHYLKKQLGSSVSEGNFEELFHIWSGNTCNGKSLLALLLTITLGSDGYLKEDGEICRYPYACPYEPEFLTCEKRTGPAPEIIAARLARILIGTEPDAGQKIKSNFMKKLTGNDLVSGRLLFSNEIISFTPLFKLILLCNKIPVMDQNDPAVWRRSRVVDFPVTFVDNPQMPNERQIDRTLKTKFTEDIEWRREFMIMLLEWYYDLFLEEGMSNPPASVLSATSEYQEQSIPIANFWNTCISRADNHMCLECVLEQCQDRAQENKDKSFDNYKVKDVQTELEGLGVIIRKQVRCRCGGRRRGVSNVWLSAERMAEIAEKERLEVERMREVANQM